MTIELRSREQELMELLQEQEALIKKAAGTSADRVSLLNDPGYVNTYMQLATERRRILEEQEERSRLDSEDKAYQAKEEWYTNKIKSSSSDQKEARQKQLESINSEYKDKLREFSQYAEDQREYINQFFQATSEEVELLIQKGYEFGWGVNESSGVFSCRLHEDVTSRLLGDIIVHLHQEPIQHREVCYENLDLECEEIKNKAIQEQKQQLAQLKQNEIERWQNEERKRTINKNRKDEQEFNKKFGLVVEPEIKRKKMYIQEGL
jgi:hypothetical protein